MNIIIINDYTLFKDVGITLGKQGSEIILLQGKVDFKIGRAIKVNGSTEMLPLGILGLEGAAPEPPGLHSAFCLKRPLG